MMFFSSIAAVAALSATASAIDPRVAVIQRARYAEDIRSAASSSRSLATTLHPIHPDVFETAFEVEKRDVADHITPASEAHMAWGAPGMQGQIHLANMTVYAPHGLPIVMMERFEGLTSSVDCKGDDGEMALRFKSKAAYQKALESWKYINEHEMSQFVMITNHDGCGPTRQRQAYKINNVDDDETDYSVSLKATAADWKEVAGTMDLDFGKAAMSEEGLNGLVDSIKKRADWDKTVDISFEHGTPDTEFTVFEDFMHNPPYLNLSCVDCYTKGTFQTTGTIRTEDLHPKEVRLDILPKDIEAEVQLKAVIAKVTPEADWSHFDKTIFEAPIPGAGIDIPGIFSLGAKFEFNLQGRVMLIGVATIYMGGTTTLDNGAELSVDLVNANQTFAKNFNAHFDPEFRLGTAQITANAVTGPQPKLVFGISILDNDLEAALTFDTPAFNLNATAGFNEDGWCNETDPVTSGFKVQSAANFAMSASVNYKVEGKDDQPLYNRKLVNIPWLTFLNKCYDVPGLTPANNDTESAAMFAARSFVNEVPNVAVPRQF